MASLLLPALLDFPWRTVSRYFSLVENHDTVSHLIGFFEIVRGQQDGFAVGTESANLRPDAAARFDIETGCGFIQKEQIGIAANRQSKPNNRRCSPPERSEYIRFSKRSNPARATVSCNGNGCG